MGLSYYINMNGKRILFLAFPMIIAALMVGFHYHSLPGSDWLQDKGIVPRTMQGLWGLIGVHFIHGNNTHLWANVHNIIFLMYITIAYFPSIAKYIFIYTFIITPILMWLFCRGGVMHIGARLGFMPYLVFCFLQEYLPKIQGYAQSHFLWVLPLVACSGAYCHIKKG